MNRRRGLIVGLAVVVLLVVVVAIGTDDEVALDPDSTAPSGARALVLLLETFADEVQVIDRPPEPDIEAAVVLDDRYTAEARSQLSTWLRDGGTLVVADPSSPFVPPPAEVEVGTLDSLTVQPGRCNISALDSVGPVEVPGRVSYPIEPAARSCFGDASSGYVVVTDVGSGTLVAVGGAGAWTNSALDRADNAVLAVALLAPDPDVDIAVLRRHLRVPLDPARPVDTAPSGDDRGDDVGSGTTGLIGLMPDYLRWVVAQAGIAWLVYAAARARRLGRPVPETQPVRLPGSEIVRASGRLLRRTPAAETAALLSDSLRHDLVTALGLPRDTEPSAVAAVAAQRFGLEPDEVQAVLTGAWTVTGDAELVHLCARIDRIREEVAGVGPS